jgi:hypothetical protein
MTPQPGAPDPFSMANVERTRTLLSGAGFTAVHTEEVPVRFTFAGLDDYLSFAADTAGPFAIVLRGLTDVQRGAFKALLGEAFAPFVSESGYEVPGVSLNAVAS